MTALPDACAELARVLPAAYVLMTRPDADGITGTGQPSSAPPWNAAAAAAAMDAHEGLRRLEAALRTDVTGRPGQRRGASDGNTAAALRAIEDLGNAVTAGAAAAAARILCRWSTAILQLPAVDEAEHPQRVRSACPYCKFPMLRVFPRSGRVACLRGLSGCTDSDGQPPQGTIGRSQLDGTPRITWADGLVT